MECHRRTKRYLIPAMLLLISIMLFHPNTVQAESTEEYIMYYLIEHTGMTPAAACGVLANMDCESRFNPGVSSPTGAFGLCQWTNPRYSRLVSHCSSRGLAYNSVEGQLSFIVEELNSYFQNVLSYMCSLGNDAGAAYLAGYYWCLYYEGSGSSSLSAYRGGIAGSEYWSSYGSDAFYLSVTNGGSGVKLSWPSGNGKSYEIKRSEKRGKGYKKIAAVDGAKCSYVDQTAKVGKKYYYYVTALNKKGKTIRSTNKASITAMKSLGQSSCSVTLSKQTYSYDGKEKKPGVTVYYGKKKLEKNRDYTVSYMDNINAGTAKVIVRGIGKYAGVAKKSFAINKAERKVTVKNISVTWAKKMKQVTLKVGVKGASVKDVKLSLSGGKVARLKKGKVTFIGCGVAKGTAYLKGDKNHKAVRVAYTVTVKPQKQVITHVSGQEKNTVKVCWKRDKKANGYQIAWSKSGKIDKDTVYKNVQGNSIIETLIGDDEKVGVLNEKTSYWIAVRSYAGQGDNAAYGDWSKMVMITLP